MKKIITLSLALILMLSIQAQTIEGDALISFVGTKTDAPATQNFFNAYEIKNTAGIKYSTFKNGIDITTKNDTIVDMSIYKSNSLYGSYTNKLPKGVTFGLSSAEVIKILGKPTMEYINSGYSEYHFGKYVMTYWYEQGVLTQVSILLQ
jgi:hypothetical protein